MAKKVSASAFVGFLSERCAAKDGYLMGAVGEYTKDVSKGSWLITQYSGAQRTKAIWWLANAVRVWDCNGLAEGYYKDVTGTSINTRARNNHSEWCSPKGTGKIPNAQKKPGAAVFMYSASEKAITHVGFLEKPVDPKKPTGDWYVIEARGVMYGVVRTKLSARGWNRWGLMTKYFDYTAAAQPDTGAPEANPYKLPTGDLKRGDKDTAARPYVRWLQWCLVKLGFNVGSYGIDGDFGRDTERALKAYEEAKGLPQDGIADATVRALLLEETTCEQTTPSDETAGGGSKNPYSPPERELNEGNKGQDVKWLQTELNEAYPKNKLDVDGEFGPKTRAAVVKFKKAHGLQATGNVGAQTVALLLGEEGACEHEQPAEGGKKKVKIDVSHHNPNDWDKAVQGADIEFVIARVQDNTVLDKHLKANIQAFHRLGIRYGLYAYVEASTAAQAKTEAELFYKRAMAVGARPETWMVDAEEGQNSAKAVSAFGTRVRELVGAGAQVGLYSFDSAINGKYKAILDEFDVIWDARWNTPDIAPAYKKYGLWQYGYVTVPGLGNKVDGNRLRPDLTLDAFLALRKKAA